MEQRAAEHMEAKAALKAIGRPFNTADPQDAEELVAVQRMIRSKIDFERAFDAWANRGYSETEEWPDGRP